MKELCVSDGFTGQYRSKTAFMQALVDCANIELIKAGVRDAIVSNVIWTEPDARRDSLDHPVATVCFMPGGATGLPDVDRVREAFRRLEKQRAAAAATEEQGRLV